MATYRALVVLALCFAMSNVPGQTTTAVGAARQLIDATPPPQRASAAAALHRGGPRRLALHAAAP
jgi:hypothetical protein